MRYRVEAQKTDDPIKYLVYVILDNEVVRNCSVLNNKDSLIYTFVIPLNSRSGKHVKWSDVSAARLYVYYEFGDEPLGYITLDDSGYYLVGNDNSVVRRIEPNYIIIEENGKMYIDPDYII